MIPEQFLTGLNDWNNHLPLMWLALEETGTGDVVEMGCGDGSTRQLHEYCKDNRRVLYSFDTDRTWIDRFKDCETVNHKFQYIENNWHIAKDICPNPFVILIDHAPGERRVVDVARFATSAKILVLHDTQPQPTAADYGWEKIWPMFKYRVDLTAPVNPEPAPDGRLHNRNWATALSNFIDVTAWKGKSFGEYELR